VSLSGRLGAGGLEAPEDSTQVAAQDEITKNDFRGSHRVGNVQETK
jgi:hypothetical protein